MMSCVGGIRARRARTDAGTKASRAQSVPSGYGSYGANFLLRHVSKLQNKAAGPPIQVWCICVRVASLGTGFASPVLYATQQQGLAFGSDELFCCVLFFVHQSPVVQGCRFLDLRIFVGSASSRERGTEVRLSS